MTRERRVYKPRLVGGKVMLAPHKYMLDIEHIDHISDEMRAVVENEWPELAHKLPPQKPQGYGRSALLIFSEFLFFPLAAVGTCDPKVRFFFGLMQGGMLIRQHMTRDWQPYLPHSPFLSWCAYAVECLLCSFCLDGTRHRGASQAPRPA